MLLFLLTFPVLLPLKQKKALREQWLMDGLSGQTEEEQEAMKTQAQDDQQQTTLLQSNISRYMNFVWAYTAYTQYI